MGDQNEGTKVINIVIAILLFIMVAAAVFGVVMWGLNKYNETQADLTDQVDSMEIAKYSMYDEMEVSGTDVLTAVKTYKDLEMCVFVVTKKMNGGSVYTFGTGGSDPIDDCTPAAYGYNGNNLTGQALQYDDDLGGFAAEVLVAQPDNNKNVTPLTTKGDDSYVNQKGKFWASLVYDKDTGEVAGVLFRQTR